PQFTGQRLLRLAALGAEEVEVEVDAHPAGGGDANLGVWARTADGWRWLAHTLTVQRLRELLPETAGLPVTRHLLPNLRAVNFTLTGLLGEGVAARHRFDPQAKALGEWLRSRHLDIPTVLLDRPEAPL
ncbi:hypothetical protein ABZW03_16510, partial [Kitasatospora sp. NPDC004799]